MCVQSIFSTLPFRSTDSISIWLGMYRPVNSTGDYDIRYNSDDMLIKYANWNFGQPFNRLGNEYCVKAYMMAEYVWYDIICDVPIYFICEI